MILQRSILGGPKIRGLFGPCKLISQRAFSTQNEERFLVTGGQGFIGAWIVKHLLDENKKVTVLDVKKDDNILQQVLSPQQLLSLDRKFADIADSEYVISLVENIKPTTIIHMAGLQVPTCKANPLLGAKVNVIGTLNVFEAAKNLREKHKSLPKIVYASSAAVSGKPGDYVGGVVSDDTPHKPLSHYGVFKLANEGNARVYWHDHQIGSVGLRPFTVYGVGREFGMTSAPTKALKSAVLGRDYTIPFGGEINVNYVEDIAALFIACGRAHQDASYALNIKGDVISVAEWVEMLESESPAMKGRIKVTGDPLPFPTHFSETGLARLLTDKYPMPTPVRVGIHKTLEKFTELHKAGLLHSRDL